MGNKSQLFAILIIGKNPHAYLRIKEILIKKY